MNEFERDDRWARSLIDRLLRPVLSVKAGERVYGQLVILGAKSSIGQFIQRQAHLDAIVQLALDDELSLEFKVVRWPRRRDGTPSLGHYTHAFLEDFSQTVPEEKAGWMKTSKADVLLWCQASLDERALACFPFPFAALRVWLKQPAAEGLSARWWSFPERLVENRIDGRALWTHGRLVPIDEMCEALHVEGFRVIEGGLVEDLFGKPLLRFMEGRPVDV